MAPHRLILSQDIDCRKLLSIFVAVFLESAMHLFCKRKINLHMACCVLELMCKKNILHLAQAVECTSFDLVLLSSLEVFVCL